MSDTINQPTAEYDLECAGNMLNGNVCAYTMPAEDYHADPCIAPALSNSIAKKLLDKTPYHAWASCPKSPLYHPGKAGASGNIGSAVHALTLDDGRISVIEYHDYRSAAARSQRDYATAKGNIPLNLTEYAQARQMSSQATPIIKDILGQEYQTELTVLWYDREYEFDADSRFSNSAGWRRARLDAVSNQERIIFDLKTTKADIDIDSISRLISDNHYDMQAAAYREAMETLYPGTEGRWRFVFLFQEQSYPYAVSSPVELSNSFLNMGWEKWRHAKIIWDDCVVFQDWPGHDRKTTTILPTDYAVNHWNGRMQFDNRLNSPFAGGVNDA
jgi:hypothetical protein